MCTAVKASHLSAQVQWGQKQLRDAKKSSSIQLPLEWTARHQLKSGRKRGKTWIADTGWTDRKRDVKPLAVSEKIQARLFTQMYSEMATNADSLGTALRVLCPTEEA